MFLRLFKVAKCNLQVTVM